MDFDELSLRGGSTLYKLLGVRYDAVSDCCEHRRLTETLCSTRARTLLGETCDYQFRKA